ncbi:MAG: hypothetical protein JSV31_03645 [Desulfobacterales bacterium]|jgi:hypothetical protein|nr:MAG: hypothetical protein JSV31_03645 [Desulfobacterales bacterium]
MSKQIDIKKIHSKIQLMKNTAEELEQLGKNFPALSRNMVRILASLKMLEINISDVVNLERDN